MLRVCWAGGGVTCDTAPTASVEGLSASSTSSNGNASADIIWGSITSQSGSIASIGVSANSSKATSNVSSSPVHATWVGVHGAEGVGGAVGVGPTAGTKGAAAGAGNGAAKSAAGAGGTGSAAVGAAASAKASHAVKQVADCTQVYSSGRA